MICAVPAEHLPILWDQVAPLVESGLRARHNDCWHVDDVRSELERSDMQIWIDWEDGRVASIVITKVTQYPRKRALTAFLASGKGLSRTVGEYVRRTEAYARSRGCDFMEAYGRNGWVRAAGYRPVGHYMTKELRYA